MKMPADLKKRVGTAAVGLVVLLGLLIFGGRTAAAFIAAVLSVGMAFEFSEICFELPDRREKRHILMGVAWLVAFLNFWIPRSEYELLILSFLGLGGYYLFTANRHPDGGLKAHFQELMYSTLGLLYLAFLPLFFPLIRDAGSGLHWIMSFLIIVWLNDTGAYFTGLRFGKRKLYPAISPKKTVEGAAGGLVVGLLGVLVYKFLIFHALSVGTAVILSLLVGVSSQIGDLFESFLKRAFNRKDSSTLLPGHGGLLDRFDGVVFGLPVMYGCIRIFSS